MPTNPITLRLTPDKKKYPPGVCLTIGRLHTREGNNPPLYCIPVVMYKEAVSRQEHVKDDQIIGSQVFDEDHFIRGLKELFPDYTIIKTVKPPPYEPGHKEIK